MIGEFCGLGPEQAALAAYLAAGRPRKVNCSQLYGVPVSPVYYRCSTWHAGAGRCHDYGTCRAVASARPPGPDRSGDGNQRPSGTTAVCRRRPVSPQTRRGGAWWSWSWTNQHWEVATVGRGAEQWWSGAIGPRRWAACSAAAQQRLCLQPSVSLQQQFSHQWWRQKYKMTEDMHRFLRGR